MGHEVTHHCRHTPTGFCRPSLTCNFPAGFETTLWCWAGRRSGSTPGPRSSHPGVSAWVPCAFQVLISRQMHEQLTHLQHHFRQTVNIHVPPHGHDAIEPLAMQNVEISNNLGCKGLRVVSSVCPRLALRHKMLNDVEHGTPAQRASAIRLARTHLLEDCLRFIRRECRCCLDTEPRTLDAESANLLCNFAEMVVREIEKEKMRVRAALPARASLLIRGAFRRSFITTRDHTIS